RPVSLYRVEGALHGRAVPYPIQVARIKRQPSEETPPRKRCPEVEGLDRVREESPRRRLGFGLVTRCDEYPEISAPASRLPHRARMSSNRDPRRGSSRLP